MPRNEWTWETVDFRPAPPGWRAALVWDPDQAPEVVDLPGWLVQHYVPRTEFDEPRPVLDTDGDPAAPQRRVVAGVLEEDEVVASDENDNVIVVLGPTAPELSETEIRELQDRRRRTLAAREAARKKREEQGS